MRLHRPLRQACAMNIDDIKERQSTLKINAINIIYYLVIRVHLHFISRIIIMIKELTCVL